MGQAESERRRLVDVKRRETPCSFKDGISKEEFVSLAEKVGKKIERIRSVSVTDAVINCVVESIRGCSEWKFYVDFSDWGHITGTRWPWTENNDSNIPDLYGQALAEEIRKLYKDRNIRLPDCSDEVDENEVLGTEHGLTYYRKKRFFEREQQVCMKYDAETLTGERLYYVFSVLKNAGFKNIKAILIGDIKKSSSNYVYEVEQVQINEETLFVAGDVFETHN